MQGHKFMSIAALSCEENSLGEQPMLSWVQRARQQVVRLRAVTWMGKLPAAVSPDSMTQSVPSSTALATSVASARVGRGFLTIDSSIWVAVITGFPTCIHQPVSTARWNSQHDMSGQVATALIGNSKATDSCAGTSYHGAVPHAHLPNHGICKVCHTVRDVQQDRKASLPLHQGA